MRRVVAVTGCWFLFWMSFGVAVGALTKGPDGVLSGAMNGAWIATLTSFAWPRIMPESVEKWMDRGGT